MKRLSLQLKSDQRGLVSIVVVGVIVVLLTLITLGFSKVMDRELRQSLDQGLSSQAYYAAESGLNDARSYIKNNPSANPNPKECLPLSSPSTPPFATGGDISGNGIVRYTCVLIDMQPKELIYDVNAGSSAVFKTTAANLSNLYFSWENRRYVTTSPQPLLPGNPCSGTPLSCTLPEENAMATDATGVLRVTIYPVRGMGYVYPGDPNQQLASDSRTYFLYPNSGNGTIAAINSSAVDFNTKNGVFVQGNCNSTTYPNPSPPFAQSTQRFCNARISGLPAAAQYYVHISSVYKDLSVSIQGTNISSSDSVKLPGAEAVVDVTGEGNDVLRRVQARVPFDGGFAYPDSSINSMQTICKRFRLPKIGLGLNDYGDAYSDIGGATDPDSNCFP